MSVSQISFASSAEETVESDEVEESVKAEEIDLGDYQTEMAVGEKQLLVTTVLPSDTTDQGVTYSSSNEEVAAINGMGRITAISIGTTTIKATCGKAEESFVLTVKKQETTTEEETTVAVTDIEIDDYEDELEVDKTLNISATVLPSNATDSTVTYTSSNPSIATVKSTGEVKGISQGNVTITVSAGGVSKAVNLRVKVSATGINVNSTYVVLTPGKSFTLTAKAIPSEASQAITYKSTDSSVATVSSNGTIQGLKQGNATIVVSNGDTSNAVTVIVNAGSEEKSVEDDTTSVEDEKTSDTTEEYTKSEKKLIKLIGQGEEPVTIKAADYEKITKPVLKKLFELERSLVIQGDGYQIRIDGKDIVNYDNELLTLVELKEELGGKSFIINEENNLPGKITLTFAGEENQYLYLYSKTKSKYQILGSEKQSEYVVDIGGKYLIAEKKLTSIKVKIAIVVFVFIVLLGLVGVYIGVKKKYWFW